MIVPSRLETTVRRPLLLAVIVAATAATLARRRTARRTDTDVWTQASAAPDLR